MDFNTKNSNALLMLSPLILKLLLLINGKGQLIQVYSRNEKYSPHHLNELASVPGDFSGHPARPSTGLKCLTKSEAAPNWWTTFIPPLLSP